MKGIVTRWKKGPKELISKLVEKGVELEKFSALEMFGRDGTWHTSFFANKVRSIEIWEIDKKWEKKLKNNFPNAKIRILDSIKTIKEEENLTKFNLLLIDNPMNIFGQNQEESDKNYCEHFEILPKISKIIQDESLVIFNINRCPFDYDKYPLWKQRREKFYGNTDTSNMSLEFLQKFYTKLFKKIGFRTIFYINTVRIFYLGNDMTYYFAYYLKKNKK